MISFWNRTVRVKEMGGKFYVEVKNKAFETGVEDATVNTAEVSICDTMEEVEDFIAKEIP